MEIWTCGSSPPSGSWNARKRTKNIKRCQASEQHPEFFRRDPNDFLSRLVTMDETRLYHYDPQTKQQPMEWRHSDSLRPKKIPSAKIRWKISRLDFLEIKTASSSLIIFQRAKLSTRCVSQRCWRNWRTFWRKNASRSSPKGSCSCTKMPRLSGHLQPGRNSLTWASNVLMTLPILQN